MAGLGLFGEAGLSAEAGAGSLCTGVTRSVGAFGFYGEVGGTAQYANGHISGATGIAGPSIGYGAGVSSVKTAMYCFKI